MTSLPAQTLAQRADLAALERELAALAADVGVAQANRKPRLTLSGNIGWGALRFGGLNGGETGSGLAWGFGPVLNLPIFDAGRRKASADAARARYSELSAQYQFKARMAVREVEEAMLRLDAAGQRQAHAEAAIKDFQAYLAAAETRYRVGVGNLIELQDARRQTIAAQLNLIQLRRERNLQWIALYKTLGGGWDGNVQVAIAPESRTFDPSNPVPNKCTTGDHSRRLAPVPGRRLRRTPCGPKGIFNAFSHRPDHAHGCGHQELHSPGGVRHHGAARSWLVALGCLGRRV